MPNHIKFCSCRQCKRGKRTKSGSEMVKRQLRSARRKAKQAINKGEEPIKTVSIPYTD